MIDQVSDLALVGDRYRLISRVGNGQMSSVYRAEDLRRPDTLVAVKLLDTTHPDQWREQFFRREAHALEHLDHKHIVRIHKRGWSDEHSCFYLVLEWLPYTYEEMRSKHGKVPNWIFRLMMELTSALTHAHSNGIVHRDIKPSNILFDASETAKLGDFGISRIKNELSTGLTLAHFWSMPYAAPEQRRGAAEDERSDIYALGIVFYELIAGHPPSSSGPTPEEISSLPATDDLRALIQRMTAAQPKDRPQDMSEVKQFLTAQRRAASSTPTIYLVVGEGIATRLYRDLGVLPRPSLAETRQWLTTELANDEQAHVKVTLDERSGDVLLHGRRVLLRCGRRPRLPFLSVKYVELPYLPVHEAAREAGKAVRARWEFITLSEGERIPASKLPQLRKTLDQLFDLGYQQNIKKSVARVRRIERRGFVETWEKVLRYQRRLLDEATQPLQYQSVHTQEGVLVFTLPQAPPDSLNWPDGAIIAATGREDTHVTPLGELLDVSVNHVSVLRGSQYAVGGDEDKSIPPQGTISLFSPERRATIDRQSKALKLLRSGDTANPRLSEVLTDIARAEFDEPDSSITFFQPDLAEDKRQAVREALAARDIFLLQGPPGTGKTATIAEIILQILREDPDARILVSSQSNVAVNHVLSRVTAARPDSPVEIVRLGRSEKIGRGGEQWQLEQRQAAWRQEVVARCEAVRAELTAEIRKKTAAHKMAKAVLSEMDLRQCRDWLEEATHTLEAFQENQHQLIVLDEQTVMTAVQDGEDPTPDSRTRHEHVALLEVIRRQRQQILDDLAVIRSFLPEQYQGEPLTQPEEELARLNSLVSDLSEPGSADDVLARKRRLVQSWMQVAGLGREFASPLLKRANLLAATCIFSGGPALKNERFDWVIIDEAGRATAPELLVPLIRAERAILVGDERQLPPLLDEEVSPKRLAEEGITEENLERSLFESLVEEARSNNPRVLQMLTTQHRMHPAIGQLISDVFYDGKLSHGVAMTERQHSLAWLPHIVLWISTSSTPQRADERRGSSRANPLEAEIIERLLQNMDSDYAARGQTREIGVIAGYKGQVKDLIDRIEPENQMRWRSLDIEISTVDAFQGRDRDIIIYSTVRSNAREEVGFLRDRRRLNVSLSRAKELLIIVGDAAMLEAFGSSSIDNPFRDVLHYIRTHPGDCALLPWPVFSSSALRRRGAV